MGFMVAQMLATYSMPYREVMSLPIAVFWALSGFVPRVLASKAKLTLQVNAAAQSPEGIERMNAHLAEIAPEPVQRTQMARILASSQKDEQGIARLRAMVG